MCAGYWSIIIVSSQCLDDQQQYAYLPLAVRMFDIYHYEALIYYQVCDAKMNICVILRNLLMFQLTR